jgi:hypothetical protein
MRLDRAFQFWLAVLAMGGAAALASIGAPDRYSFAVLVGLGLGIMMLAVVRLRFVVRDEQRAEARLREIRIKLATYTQAGQRVISLCHAADKVRAQAPMDAANEWSQTVYGYLEEKLGSDYAVRFDSPAGLPTGMTVLYPPYSDIEGHVKSRLARLGEFMMELAT